MVVRVRRRTETGEHRATGQQPQRRGRIHHDALSGHQGPPLRALGTAGDLGGDAGVADHHREPAHEARHRDHLQARQPPHHDPARAGQGPGTRDRGQHRQDAQQRQHPEGAEDRADAVRRDAGREEQATAPVLGPEQRQTQGEPEPQRAPGARAPPTRRARRGAPARCARSPPPPRAADARRPRRCRRRAPPTPGPMPPRPRATRHRWPLGDEQPARGPGRPPCSPGGRSRAR